MNSFLLIEPIDFTRPIYGSGGASVVVSALNFFENQVCLVGATSEDIPLGKWCRVEINNHQYNFLPIINVKRLNNPRSGSSNLDFALCVWKYRSPLINYGIRRVLTQTYTVLWVLNIMSYMWDICFFYPGLGNPMLIGRKPRIGVIFGCIYEFIQGMMIRKATVVFAAASQVNINRYNNFLKRIGTMSEVKMLPTGVNTDIYRPQDKASARTWLGLNPDSLILCYVGRLAKVKGLPLIIHAVKHILKDYPQTKLLVVGDGEEKENLVNMVKNLNMQDNLILYGVVPPVKVAAAICASDVCVVGSYVEGLSVAMIEEIACGRPIVSTDVSGARDLIFEGINGYIVKNRDPIVFACRILDAKKLQSVEAFSVPLVEEKYSEKCVWLKLQHLWSI